jgi:hypothetical protein
MRREWQAHVTGKGWVCNPIGNDRVTAVRSRYVGEWDADYSPEALAEACKAWKITRDG